MILNSLPTGYVACFCCCLLIFFKINFFEKIFQEYHQIVKQFGSRSGLTSGLIWIQTVSKGNQQMALVVTPYPTNIFVPIFCKCCLIFTSTAYIQMHFRLQFIMGVNSMNPGQTAPFWIYIVCNKGYLRT